MRTARFPDSGNRSDPVLVIGHGLIGARVRSMLVARGVPVAVVARRPWTASHCHALDLSAEQGLRALRSMLETLRPLCVVLCHGPSNVSWIEEHEAEAAVAHSGVAALIAQSDLRAVLVSTDNVFSGTRGRYRPRDATRPSNAYGRVKAQAEDLLLAGGAALVLRASLVYGWSDSRHRENFAERCLRAAFDHRRFVAPTDQWSAPLHADDVARVVVGACTALRFPTAIRHLAGPDELSRFDFARLAYRLAAAEPDLVQPCLRRDTEWASRPGYSSLECSDFADLAGLADWRPMGPEAGLKEMLADVDGRARRFEGAQ